jgi:hypothetical protein
MLRYLPPVLMASNSGMGNCESIMADQDLPIHPPWDSDDGDISSPPSDSHDTTYSEPPLRNNQGFTSQQRKSLLQEFSEAAKQRVQKATANLTNLRCIVLNAPDLYNVNYAHMLPRATSPKVVSNEKFLYF